MKILGLQGEQEGRFFLLAVVTWGALLQPAGAGFEFLRAQMPLGASGSCLNFLALCELGSGCWKAILCHLPVPRCCWSAELLEGGTDQILWLPLGTLIGIGFSLEGTKRIISWD